MANTIDVQLLYIFPKEIWEMILENVEGPADLENLTNFSPLFRNCLLSKRVNFFFPKFFKLLDIRYLHDDEDNSFYCRPCEKYHWRYSSPFSIRLVCKTWSKTVDECFQSLPSKHNDKLSEDNELECMIRESNKPLSRRRVLLFLRHFKNTHLPELERNPFVSRKISLELGNQTGFNYMQRHHNQLAAVRHLFRNYGQHVWFFDIKLHGKAMNTAADVLEKLGVLFNLLPNLKSLYIQITHEFGSNGQVLRPVNFPHENLLVPMQNLRVLSTSKLPASIFNGLLPSISNGVQVLELTSGNSGYFAYHGVSKYNIFTTPFPNLRILSLSIWLRVDFERFEKSKVDWKLEKLKLEVSSSEFISWSEIFDAVNAGKWAKTLTTLEIKLPRSKKEDYFIKAPSSLKMKLPRLERLKLEIPNFLSLDFLLAMKGTLENLEIDFLLHLEKEEYLKMAKKLDKTGQVLKLLFCSEKLVESNVWELLPKLKRLKVEELIPAGRERNNMRVCTRSDWLQQIGYINMFEKRQHKRFSWRGLFGR